MDNTDIETETEEEISSPPSSRFSPTPPPISPFPEPLNSPPPIRTPPSPPMPPPQSHPPNQRPHTPSTDSFSEDEQEEIMDTNKNSNILVPLSKSPCLVIIDLLFWLLPNTKLFGGTVRDILAENETHHINVLIDDMSSSSLRKLTKFRQLLQIFGYHLHIELFNDDDTYSLSQNLSRNGMTQAIIEHLGYDQSLKLLIVSSPLLKRFQPIFRCDMLYLSRGGTISLREHPQLHHHKLSSKRIETTHLALQDIYSKQINLIDQVIPKEETYQSRFVRSKILCKSIRLLEKGWELGNFTLADCGLKVGVYRLETRRLVPITYQTTSSYELTYEEGNPQDELCVICQEPLLTKTTVMTDCSHVFHNKCLFYHLYKIGQQSNNCPICRSPIISNQENNNQENNPGELEPFDLSNEDDSNPEEEDYHEINSYAIWNLI